MRQGMSSARILIVILVVMGAGLVVLSIGMGVGPRISAIGGAGMGQLSQLALLGGSEVGPNAERTGAEGDGRLDIVAVPLIYAEDDTTEDRFQERFQDWVSQLEPRLEQDTPFREASDPATKVRIQTMSPDDVSLPELTGTGSMFLSGGEFLYASFDCSSGHQAMHEAAEQAGMLDEADMVMGWVNGSQEGRAVILEGPGVSGCADDIGGSLALVEQSRLSADPVGAMLHEFGHLAGLCHNQGVQRETSEDTLCDLTRSPDRSSVCATRNNERSDGDRSIMNYCQPWERFAGSVGTGDEYPMLEQYFEDAGWLEQQ